MANVVANVQKPALVIAPNKTLAAQLYNEFKQLFPENAVEYFVSYYDYYQPEAYIPSTDTYIEKDTSINDDIDRLRLRATSSLLEREDVIIVASVSCIYGLGSPEDYKEMMIFIETGRELPRDQLLRDLIKIQYNRNDIEFGRGTFRVRGDVVEIHPAYDEIGVRIEYFGDEIEKITIVNLVDGHVLGPPCGVTDRHAKDFIIGDDVVQHPSVDAAVGIVARSPQDETIRRVGGDVASAEAS